MKQYLQLLKSHKVFRRLSIIQLIAYFGAWFSNVAIYTLLIELEADPKVIAFVAMLHFLAGIVQAPISGSIIDSVKPKKLMLILISFEIVSTFLLIFIDTINDLNFLYVLIFVKMAAASFYFTAEMSLLPKILDGSKLQRANELHSIIWSLSYTLGMAASGFFVYWMGIKAAFILDTFMFIGAFLLLYTLKIDIDIIRVQEKLLDMMRGTFKYLKKYPHAMHLMFVHSFIGLTAFDALVALMVDQYYTNLIAASLALGFLHATRALGLIFGPILLRKLTNNRYLIYVFIGQGVAVWIWGYMMDNFYLSLLASLFVGFFSTTLWSYTYTLLQKNIDETYYGRIVAYNDMLFLTTAAFTSYMTGFLVENGVTLEGVAFIMGVGFILGGLYFKWVVKTQNIKEIN
jgi:MFS family permease